MPVPPLKDTVQGYLKSVKHLLDQAEYNEMEVLAKVRATSNFIIYIVSIIITFEAIIKLHHL